MTFLELKQAVGRAIDDPDLDTYESDIEDVLNTAIKETLLRRAFFTDDRLIANRANLENVPHLTPDDVHGVRVDEEIEVGLTKNGCIVIYGAANDLTGDAQVLRLLDAYCVATGDIFGEEAYRVYFKTIAQMQMLAQSTFAEPDRYEFYAYIDGVNLAFYPRALSQGEGVHVVYLKNPGTLADVTNMSTSFSEAFQWHAIQIATDDIRKRIRREK